MTGPPPYYLPNAGLSAGIGKKRFVQKVDWGRTRNVRHDDRNQLDVIGQVMVNLLESISRVYIERKKSTVTECGKRYGSASGQCEIQARGTTFREFAGNFHRRKELPIRVIQESI